MMHASYNPCVIAKIWVTFSSLVKLHVNIDQMQHGYNILPCSWALLILNEFSLLDLDLSRD